jgi:ring-1,2-phenylacetyl-CoA epoxidase subunit PaaD
VVIANAASTTTVTADNELTVAVAWDVLHTVLDPEVPVVSICDLGIVRSVQMHGERGLDVVLTPTYSGCPATELIASETIKALTKAGFNPVNLTTTHAPAWTSDWISPEGRDKLRRYGIAPPATVSENKAGQDIVLRYMPQGRSSQLAAPKLDCPRCGSANTERLSAFGSTACKALWRCLACKEPFEHFKPF